MYQWKHVAIACDRTLNINAIASCMGLNICSYIAIGNFIRKPGIRNTASPHYVVEDRSDEIFYLSFVTCNASSYVGAVNTTELTLCMYTWKGVARYEAR